MSQEVGTRRCQAGLPRGRDCFAGLTRGKSLASEGCAGPVAHSPSCFSHSCIGSGAGSLACRVVRRKPGHTSNSSTVLYKVTLTSCSCLIWEIETMCLPGSGRGEAFEGVGGIGCRAANSLRTVGRDDSRSWVSATLVRDQDCLASAQLQSGPSPGCCRYLVSRPGVGICLSKQHLADFNEK